MKVETQNLKPNAMLANGGQRTGNLTSVFCILYSIVLFSAGVTIASEQTDAAQTANLEMRYSISDKRCGGLAIPSSRQARQLWRSNVSVPQSQGDKRYKDRLWRLIEQIRSIRLERKEQVGLPQSGVELPQSEVIAEPVIIAEPTPKVEPNETSSPAVAPSEHTEKQPQLESDGRLPYKPVSDKTLQMLENLSQQAGQVDKAFELAEILFLSGNLKRAAKLYQHALNQVDPNDVTSSEDRAWILFQIGNCLISSDPITAKRMYEQLLTEYLNSPWAALAKAKENLIDWYLNDKPQTLIAECK